MTVESTPQNSGFGKVTSWIAGVTGILIVVPALINAGADIIAEIRKLPKSEAEKINVVLFEKHFGKNPLHRGEIPIKTKLGTVNMELEVHNGGDIFVRYGDSSQWFHSPMTKLASAPSIIGAAHAEPRRIRLAGAFKQFDSRNKGNILRKRYYSSGRTETYIINPATGQWSKSASGTHQHKPPPVKPTVPTFTYPAIDLTKKK